MTEPVETLDDEMVAYRLREAGRTWLAMPAALRPAFDDAFPAMPSASGKFPAPTAPQIARMREAMEWLALIPAEAKVIRQVVSLRAMANPQTGSEIFSWRALAKAAQTDWRAVRKWHAHGIRVIVGALRLRRAAA
jgi:hypothetical protein